METTIVFRSDVRMISRPGTSTPVKRALNVLTGTAEGLAQFKRDVASGNCPTGTVDPMTGDCILWTDEPLAPETTLVRTIVTGRLDGRPLAMYYASGTSALLRKLALDLACERPALTLQRCIEFVQMDLNAARASQSPAAMLQANAPAAEHDSDDPIDGIESPAPVAKKRGRKPKAA